MTYREALETEASSVVRAARRRELDRRWAEAALAVARNREAERRRGHVHKPAPSRPGGRRSMSVAERRDYRLAQGGRGILQVRAAGDFNLSAGANIVTLSGFACVTDRWYEMSDAAGPFQERVMRGAFQKTLRENPRIVAVVNHGQGGQLPLARFPDTLRLAETHKNDLSGLWADADLDAGRTDVRDLLSAVQTGALIGLSFAFRVLRQEWDDACEMRTIREVSLADGDISFVGASANSWTDGSIELNGKPVKKTPDSYMDPFGMDPTKSGAGGYTESESVSPLLVEAARVLAANRAAELVRRSK